MSRKTIVVIGPTASGKSDLAIAIAQKHGGEVISADSRQIYRGMDIGSGKEPGKMSSSNSRGSLTKNAYICNGIPHYMIDIVHPNTEYSAGKFIKKASKIRDDIVSRKKLPIICGGTFFWAQSLVEEHDLPSVAPNKALRKELSKKPQKELFSTLKKIDPQRAKTIDRNNPVRLIRAIEIAMELGAVPKIQKNQKIHRNTLIIAIDHPREKLYERIEKRLKKRLEAGMLDEVYDLHSDQKVSWNRLESFGLEYKWCVLYLQGKVTYDEMYEKLLRDIRRYAKRQETWIRKWQKSSSSIYLVKNVKEALELCKNYL